MEYDNIRWFFAKMDFAPDAAPQTDICKGQCVHLSFRDVIRPSLAFLIIPWLNRSVAERRWNQIEAGRLTVVLEGVYVFVLCKQKEM